MNKKAIIGAFLTICLTILIGMNTVYAKEASVGTSISSVTSQLMETKQNKSTVSLLQTGDLRCKYLDPSLVSELKKIYSWIAIAAPIALIVFGCIDFATPILSNDKEALNKAVSRFAKRAILLVVIIFTPMILNAILDRLSDATGQDISICGVGYIIKSIWR